jgi:hypothetical protein
LQASFSYCKALKQLFHPKLHQWQIWFEDIPKVVELQVTNHSSLQAGKGICFEPNTQTTTVSALSSRTSKFSIHLFL